MKGLVSLLAFFTVCVLCLLELFMSSRFTSLWLDAASTKTPVSQRRAVAVFVDSVAHMYGLYSIRSRMETLGISDSIRLAVVVDRAFTNANSTTYQAWQVLNEWIEPVDLHVVDKQLIREKLINPRRGLWVPVFNKLWMFSLADSYDKILMLDLDVLIRKDIRRWFDNYEAPAATQAGDAIEWNSGVMLIEPNAAVFERMMQLLPHVQSFQPEKLQPEDPAKAETIRDPLNSSYHDQGFLSAFFTAPSDARHPMRMKTLPTEAAILSSRLAQPSYQYFAVCRRHIFETVHFTAWKPFVAVEDKRRLPRHPVVCDMLREWYDSIQGLDTYDLGDQAGNADWILQGRFLAACPEPATFSHNRPMCNPQLRGHPLASLDMNQYPMKRHVVY